MNAGKSTALLQAHHNYGERGMKTLLLCPCMDDRYGVGVIRSRIGIQQRATPFQNGDNLLECIREKTKGDKIACVLVDEAQFLTQNQVSELCRVVDELGIPVLAFGLRTDFWESLSRAVATCYPGRMRLKKLRRFAIAVKKPL